MRFHRVCIGAVALAFLASSALAAPDWAKVHPGKNNKKVLAMKFFLARAAEALLFSVVAAGVAIGALVATGSVDAVALFNAPPSNLLVAD